MDNRYYNKVIKQGNSLCVRIPLKVSKKLNLEKGTTVAVNLTNVEDKLKNLPEELLQVYKSVMGDFSLEDIKEFLQYYTIEKTTGEMIISNKNYQKFKDLLKKKGIKEKVKKEMKKTDYWKKLDSNYKKGF